MGARQFCYILSAILMIALVAMPGVSRAAQPVVLRAALNADLGSLDPARIRGSAEQQVAVNVYSSLVRFKTGTGEIVPDLATRWEISSDGKTMTFHLRQGVKFHKGFGEFTAADAKFTFERHAAKETKSRYRTSFKVVKKIEAVDRHTLRIRFHEPTPAFLVTTLAFRPGWILSRKAVEKYGKKYSFNTVGTGPFVLQSYKRGSKLILTANKDYFAGPPKIDRVEFIPIPDASVAYAAIQAGDIDIMYTRSATIFNRAMKNKNLVIMKKPSMSVRQFYLNTSRKPFNDVRVRRAVAHALDRRAILKHVLGDSGQYPDSIINPNSFAYTSDVQKYEYNPEKAKKLLVDAGYPKGFEMEFVYPMQAPYKAIAPAAASDLAKVGIKAKLIGIERVGYNKRVRRGAYNMTILGLTRPPDPDIYLTGGFYSPNSPPGNNFSYYGAADKLIEEARVETDRDKRMRLYEKIQKMAAEDVPTIPIYYPFAMVIARSYVKGHEVGILNDFVLYPMNIEK